MCSLLSLKHDSVLSCLFCLEHTHALKNRVFQNIWDLKLNKSGRLPCQPFNDEAYRKKGFNRASNCFYNFLLALFRIQIIYEITGFENTPTAKFGWKI